MNNCLTTITLIAGSLLVITGCSEDSDAFESPITSDNPTNAGTVSQTNFTVLAADLFPAIFDGTSFQETSVEISVKIGDLDNQLLTDAHTVFFKTEWGLIEKSCTTIDGKCSVTWETSSSDNFPADALNTIVAWTVGEEGFTDSNGNGKFDAADTTFEDLEEPFLDADRDGVFNEGAGDKLIDVVNGNDLTGANGQHDFGDTFLNSPNCTDSPLCSTVRNTTYIWNDVQLTMTGPPAAP